jgi:hypothetical protein
MKKPITLFLLLLALSQCAVRENKMLYVEVRISEKIAKDGGVVFMIPHKMPIDEFSEKYATEINAGEYEDGTKYQYKFSANISNTVSFVHFDAPESRYQYAFVGDGHGFKITEKIIGIAGAGNIYIDAESNNPVFVNGGIDHAIIGSNFTETDAIGVENSSLDYIISDSDCMAFTGLYICSPKDEFVRNRLDIMKENSSK